MLNKFLLLLFICIASSAYSQVVCGFDIRDTSSCSTAPLLLRVPVPYTSLLWDDGDTTASNTFTIPGLHWARVTVIDTTTVNLVVNGDFEAGRTSFSSGYAVGLPGSSTWGLLGNPGTYEVLSSPNLGHINFFTCADVTAAPGTQMLVANGASVATDVWCQTVAVTPNTTYLFSAWVSNVINDPNVAQLQFKINGGVIGAPFSTTAVGCQWRKFFATWFSGASTSANICIRNLNTTGGGNDFAIDEIRFSNICVYTDSFIYSVYAPTSGSFSDSTCSNQPYIFNGNSITTSGSYLDTLVGFHGCDSFVTLNLTVFPTTAYSYNYSICDNQSYVFNGVTLTVPGIYQDTLVNFYGCDSFLTLNLFVNSTSAGSFNQTICGNQFYSFNGVNINTAGSYMDTLLNSAGCDSVVTLNLTVNPTSTGFINQTICSNQFYLFNGVNRNISGVYLDTFNNYLMCDSVVSLNLLVNSVSASSKDTVICFGEFYPFNGLSLNASGTYKDTIANYLGCDSVMTLNLTSIPFLSTTLNRVICSNAFYLYNGQALNTAGVYLDTLISIHGCDSFITLNLSVIPTSTTYLYDTFCAGQSILFNGLVLDSSGSYRDTLRNINGCDSFIVIDLLVNPNPVVFINGGNDTIIVEGQSAFIRAYGAVNYTWSNGETISFQTVTPEETTAYAVIGVDSNNCADIDTILVIVTEERDSTKLAIPSAFSPNGDGLNDLFKVLATYNLYVDEVDVFNRWGEIVFRTDDFTTGWDGTFRGREQPLGTYVYYIVGRSKTSFNKKIYTGIVTLVR